MNLLAIDVGNTHTVFGLWVGSHWRAIWRRTTNVQTTEDELASWLSGLFNLAGIPWQVDGAICASVVPGLNSSLSMLAKKHLGTDLVYLTSGSQVGLTVTYDPPHAVGADRIANATAALAKFAPPIIVVDLGTATTFDTIDAMGRYVGGAILPGVQVSAQALFSRAAKLPSVEFQPPRSAIGRNTVDALQSGIMLGYAGSIDRLASEIMQELGGTAKVIATGGLGAYFLELAHTIECYEPDLTIDGLVLAYQMLSAG
jgi:type III pantothenate kinase